MVTTVMRGVAALATAVMLAQPGSCGEPRSGSDPNANPDHGGPTLTERVITLEWYANQPYTASWEIKGGHGLVPQGSEHVAAGPYKRPLRVGQMALLITITTSTAKGSTGWAKITDRSEVAFTTFNASSNPAVAIAAYAYKP